MIILYIIDANIKDSIVRPLLKKSNLDVDKLKHYRPVSNTHFLSKILEKLVVGGLEDHMLENLLYDPFQLPYRKQNDIIASLDVGVTRFVSCI